MDETFEIQNIMPTGKKDKFGNAEYFVKFVESEDTFKLYFKEPRKTGDKLEGHIEGYKFIKKPFVSSKTTSGAKPKRTYGAVEKDKQDGQRQGMCFNNAANYVNNHAGDKAVAEDVWAKKVWGYAKALYDLGDLTKEPESESVAETFKDAD